MAHPKTESELVASGYSYECDLKCPFCGVSVELWLDPGGVVVAFEAGTMQDHSEESTRIL